MPYQATLLFAGFLLRFFYVVATRKRTTKNKQTNTTSSANKFASSLALDRSFIIIFIYTNSHNRNGNHIDSILFVYICVIFSFVFVLYLCRAHFRVPLLYRFYIVGGALFKLITFYSMGLGQVVGRLTRLGTRASANFSLSYSVGFRFHFLSLSAFQFNYISEAI